MRAFLAYIPWLLALVFLILAVFLGYQLRKEIRLNAEISEKNAALILEIEHTQNLLDSSREETAAALQALNDQKRENQQLEGEVDDIAETVDTLQRLAETDPELLQKYSKVYFLNEHYIPSSLVQISDEYVYPKGTTESIHGDVWPRLKKLLQDAEEDGLDLFVISGYRSFGQQGSLKAAYRVTYGSGANKFSADQGYSEHQLGTTVDFTTSKVGSTFVGFDKTEEFKWLQQNAHKYGFILSYPSNNSYYQYEPWHWRFVGKDLADHLHDESKYFYDLDQRIIDQYLADIFE